MKPGSCFSLVVFLVVVSSPCLSQKTYTLISKKTATINQKTVSSLTPSLKGMAAFYSAMGGTDCMDGKCALTSALQLGTQGSQLHKDIIIKYFPEDKAAKLVLGQDCYLQPSSASSYSNFAFLSFTVNGNIVTVNYELDVVNQGTVKKIKGPDIYLYNGKTYKNTKRVLYAWTSK